MVNLVEDWESIKKSTTYLEHWSKFGFYLVKSLMKALKSKVPFLLSAEVSPNTLSLVLGKAFGMPGRRFY